MTEISAVWAYNPLLCKMPPPMRRKATSYRLQDSLHGKNGDYWRECTGGRKKEGKGNTVGEDLLLQGTQPRSRIWLSGGHISIALRLVAPNRARKFGFELVLGSRPCSVIVLCKPVIERMSNP